MPIGLAIGFHNDQYLIILTLIVILTRKCIRKTVCCILTICNKYFLEASVTNSIIISVADDLDLY